MFEGIKEYLLEIPKTIEENLCPNMPSGPTNHNGHIWGEEFVHPGYEYEDREHTRKICVNCKLIIYRNPYGPGWFYKYPFGH